MDTLQAELRDAYPILDIEIVGINEVGHDGANDLITSNRTTPWLQDVDGNANHVSDVWYEMWNVTYRDVIIVNGQNETVDVYNLTTNDLGVAANYAVLRDKLVDAAMAQQKPWQNQRDRFDINDDGFVVPLDVLIMVNEINANGPLELPPPTGTSLEAPFWDTNGDNFFSPLDILQAINFIEESDAEGEAAGELPSAVTPVGDTAALALPRSGGLESIGSQVIDVIAVPAPKPDVAAVMPPSKTSAAVWSRPIERDDDEFWLGLFT